MSEAERPESKETKGKGYVGTLIGFGAGAVVGAVTALLFAPQSGEETRDRIKDRLNEVSDKANEALDRSKEALEEARDKMSSAYEDAVDKTSSMIEQAKTRVGKKEVEKEEDEEV